MQVASQGNIIIHNHLSGSFVSSAAHLKVGFLYGNRGVEFHIANNDVGQSYVVVEMFKQDAWVSLDIPHIIELLNSQEP